MSTFASLALPALPFAAVLVGGLLTGMTGFGFSVLSVPILVLIYQPHDVVVMVLCLVPLTSLAALMAPHLYGKVRLRLCASLSGYSLIGLPLGLLLLHRFDPTWLVVFMSLVLIGFAAFSLYSPEELRLPHYMVAPTGMLGGLLATSTGLSGPAVAVYVHGRRLSHDELVATMAAYVAVVSTIGLAMLMLDDPISRQAWNRVGLLAPVAVVGVAIGRWWARKIHRSIERVTLHALGLMGFWTLTRAVLG